MSEKTHGDCIVEAGVAFVGTSPTGHPDIRYDVAIRVHEGMIAQIGPLKGMMGGNAHLPRYGGPDMIAMPGLVNSHHHFGITPLMAGVPFEPLEFWLPQFRGMRSIGPHLDTLYSAIEMLESGTTTVHHIASGLSRGPEEWHQAAEGVLGAYSKIGMRAGYSVMLRDQNILTYDGDEDLLKQLPEGTREWFSSRLYPSVTSVQSYIDFHQQLALRYQNDPRVRINFAPANLHWCSDELLTAIGSAARTQGAQIHMHLAETKRQADYARRRFGKSAVRHLENIGFLADHVTFGHCNWLEGEDSEILAGCGCSVCHNASSGLRLGSGRADVAKLVKDGVPVALGIDQSNIVDDRDMLLEMKLAWALHRGTDLFSVRFDAAQVLKQATENGSRTVGFGKIVGRLDCGQRADIVLLDRAEVERPFVDKRTPLAELLLHRAKRNSVRTVLVDGIPVVEQGRVTQIDRDAILADVHRALSAPPTAAESESAAAIAEAMPVIRSYFAKSGFL